MVAVTAGGAGSRLVSVESVGTGRAAGGGSAGPSLLVLLLTLSEGSDSVLVLVVRAGL